MHLERLSLVNFRNYESVQFRFTNNVNLVFGRNAQGKTNLLEAIYLLCIGRSFRMAKNQEMTQYDASFFTIDGKVSLDNGIQKTCVINYRRNAQKEISIDRKRLKSHSEIIGRFPVVIMAPDEFRITTGGPSERRRFIDILLSQISLSYLKDLQEYYKILKQRNRILQEIKLGHHYLSGQLQSWTESLVNIGSDILINRVAFIATFSGLLSENYRKYTESRDDLTIEMESTIVFQDKEQSRESYFSAFDEVREKERALGTTLVGPHRDDIRFKINGKDLRRYGSRGEHKSVLIALKLAEFNILQNKKEETPILLLDDCYSELDMDREERIFSSLDNVGQIFLTSPKPHGIFDRALHTQIAIDDGEVTYVE